jgi:predicted nucleic acid-binding protein
MKPKPAALVASWLAAQPTTSLYTTSITQAEILHGVLLLTGRRRAEIEAAAESMFREDFDGRILGFGNDAALPYALIASERRRAGRPISHFDAQIAAIAYAAKAVLATRNVADFKGCGVKLVDPWRAPEAAVE